MSHSPISVGIYTLGCKVNQYESEAIAEGFAQRGFSVQSPTLPCDVYVINTCTVTGESDRKAGQFIRRAIRRNPNAYVLVTGCFSQADPDAVAAIKGVDYVCGNARKLSVIDEAVRLLQSNQKACVPGIDRAAPDAYGFEDMRIAHFDRTRAYVKIEDGCENRCTYCIIPSARGSVRSKAPSLIVEEVRGLIEGGCREIVLTGIETASYGKDLDHYRLADLLEEVDRIPNIGRVRLGSLDPSLMTEKFVDRIARLSCLAPHFHLSMQSASDKILALMKRKYNARMALEGMERLRAAFPDVQFTTDMIMGFPQESDEDFQASVQFVRDAGFLTVHAFPYSRRKGTVAASMSGQLPTEIKKQRVAILSQAAKEVREQILAKAQGQTVEVLFETYQNGMAVGHTASFLQVACPSDHPLNAELHPVHITGHTEELCIGELISSH
ncbi:MAG: tRNA (N(6)-L-threonylcarbamoyladenosine(37)-C(2))-methylthiotransferase MtaB [Clostridia bacterium]|nr:tRNA (N(6)-L-threonylcarbamoyladenosine(37)-C(2))-methylthiotransferase MtaB [Clostridia bacterium]